MHLGTYISSMHLLLFSSQSSIDVISSSSGLSTASCHSYSLAQISWYCSTNVDLQVLDAFNSRCREQMVFLPRWLAHTSRSHVLTMVLILMLALVLSWDFVAHLLLVLVSHAILRVHRGADWRHPCNCDTRMLVI